MCDTEITFGGLKVAVVIDSHHYDRQYLAAPAGVVAPRLAEAVAGDLAIDA